MSDVVVSDPLNVAQVQRQHRLATVQGLDLAFLINTQHHGLVGRIQIQTDDKYQDFIARAEEREILGYRMKVASIKDILGGKIWAYSDEQRRMSKRQKDLADIFRIIESFPELEPLLTDDIRQKM